MKSKVDKKIEGFKNAVIHCDIYRRDIMVHIGNLDGLREKLMPFFNETYIDEVIAILMDTDRGKTLELTGGPIIIYFPILLSSPSNIATLAHEMFHATHFVLKRQALHSQMTVMKPMPTF